MPVIGRALPQRDRQDAGCHLEGDGDRSARWQRQEIGAFAGNRRKAAQLAVAGQRRAIDARPREPGRIKPGTGEALVRHGEDDRDLLAGAVAESGRHPVEQWTWTLGGEHHLSGGAEAAVGPFDCDGALVGLQPGEEARKVLLGNRAGDIHEVHGKRRPRQRGNCQQHDNEQQIAGGEAPCPVSTPPHPVT